MDYTIGRGWAIGVQGVVEMGCTNIGMGVGAPILGWCRATPLTRPPPFPSPPQYSLPLSSPSPTQIIV